MHCDTRCDNGQRGSHTHHAFLDMCDRRYDMDLRDERELALQRLKGLFHAGLVSVTNFR